MKRPSREEYERAVSLARAAIEEYKARPRIRADRPSPQALAARMQERLERGEDIEADLATLYSVLAERRRGRPRGTRNVAAHGAFWAALFAVDETGLKCYRDKYAGHNFTQCHAIADAMQGAGFRTFNTYNGAEKAMKSARRDIRAATLDLSRIVRPLQHQLRDMTRGIAPVIAALRAQQNELARSLAALSGRIRSDPDLMEQLKKLRVSRDKSML